MDGTVGEIRHFAASFAPRSWAFCYGQLVAIRSNTALFSILGTTYGGDGVTTFALPNFAGRVGIGFGQGPATSYYTLGETAGTNGITLSIANMPAHTHVSSASFAIPAIGDGGDTASPSGNILAAVPNMYSSIQGEDDMKASQLNVTLATSGQSQPISITQPTIGMNYIICLTGTFPSRS